MSLRELRRDKGLYLYFPGNGDFGRFGAVVSQNTDFPGVVHYQGQAWDRSMELTTPNPGSPT